MYLRVEKYRLTKKPAEGIMLMNQSRSSFDCRKVSLVLVDTFDGAKPRFLNRGKKRRSVSTLSPSIRLRALSLSKGIPRASDRGVEWVDFSPSFDKLLSNKGERMPRHVNL